MPSRMFPLFEVKLLKDCRPGELVRYQWGQACPWAWVGADTNAAGRRLVIILSEMPEEVGNHFTPPGWLHDDSKTTVISYGGHYRIETDQDERNISIDGARFERKGGSLVAVAGGLAVWARSLEHKAADYLLFDITNGRAVEKPSRGYAQFLKWRLLLVAPPGGSNRNEEIAAFNS